MAQYGNLKDYFIGEHIELIKGAIIERLEHELNNGFYINNPIVKSLVCTNDDAQFNVEYELGISTDITIDHITDSRSFILTLTGNLEKKLNDIKVIDVEDISENDFPSDNLLSQFILPNIPISEIERIGNEMFAKYKKSGMTDGCHLSVDRLIEQETFFYSPLPDNCLGRIILTETDVEVFYRENDEQIKCKNHSAIPGTILLNKKKYFDAYDGSWMITIAHELVHSWFHTRFFKVLTLLDQTHVDLNSSADTVTFNDSMTDAKIALCIAEWQADALAMRLAIPQSTVDTMIERIANDPSTHYENLGDRMQVCVNKFAKLYNVSPYVVKERLRQLGYDFVDGTCIEVDGDMKKPFYFKPYTLNDNETFVIYRTNYEKLLQEDKDFADLIESKTCVFTGYVVCINSPKYISYSIYNNEIRYDLSDYAREHADECCLKFTLLTSDEINEKVPLEVHAYLCSLKISKNKKQVYEQKKNQGLAEIMDNKAEKRNRDHEMCDQMHKEGITTFSEALKYIMSTSCITNDDLAEFIGCDNRTIQYYRNGSYPDTIEKVMLICLALETGPKVSKYLIEKSVGDIPDIGKKRTAYTFLLENTDSTIEEWNRYLDNFDMQPIYFTKPDCKNN